MSLQQNTMANIFGEYTLEIPQGLSYHVDGQAGKRVVFITDPDETFLVSFEEGMEMMDLLDFPHDNSPCVSSTWRSGSKYIHQKRTDPESRKDGANFAFFHMEITDEKGKVHILPGQMTAPCGFKWADDVEPVLIAILNRLIVC